MSRKDFSLESARRKRTPAVKHRRRYEREIMAPMRRQYRAEEKRYEKEIATMPSLEQQTPSPAYERFRLDSPDPGFVTNPIDLVSRGSRHSDSLRRFSRTPSPATVGFQTPAQEVTGKKQFQSTGKPDRPGTRFETPQVGISQKHIGAVRSTGKPDFRGTGRRFLNFGNTGVRNLNRSGSDSQLLTHNVIHPVAGRRGPHFQPVEEDIPPDIPNVAVTPPKTPARPLVLAPGTPPRTPPKTPALPQQEEESFGETETETTFTIPTGTTEHFTPRSVRLRQPESPAFRKTRAFAEGSLGHLVGDVPELSEIQRTKIRIAELEQQRQDLGVQTPVSLTQTQKGELEKRKQQLTAEHEQEQKGTQLDETVAEMIQQGQTKLAQLKRKPRAPEKPVILSPTTPEPKDTPVPTLVTGGIGAKGVHMFEHDPQELAAVSQKQPQYHGELEARMGHLPEYVYRGDPTQIQQRKPGFAEGPRQFGKTFDVSAEEARMHRRGSRTGGRSGGRPDSPGDDPSSTSSSDPDGRSEKPTFPRRRKPRKRFPGSGSEKRAPSEKAPSERPEGGSRERGRGRHVTLQELAGLLQPRYAHPPPPASGPIVIGTGQTTGIIPVKSKDQEKIIIKQTVKQTVNERKKRKRSSEAGNKKTLKAKRSQYNALKKEIRKRIIAEKKQAFTKANAEINKLPPSERKSARSKLRSEYKTKYNNLMKQLPAVGRKKINDVDALLSKIKGIKW
jgi:hypothetical protein